MATAHNPSNFNPADYEVRGYFDNRRPEYVYGMTADEYEAVVQAWEVEAQALFGPEWQQRMHHCMHCGQSNVRYVAAATHLPTGEIVCFGDICANNRLSLPGRDEFKRQFIRSKAENDRRHALRMAKVEAWLKANPEFQVVVDHKDEPVHTKNGFLHDVVRKLWQYGTISERQRDAVLRAYRRDIEYTQRRAEAEALPRGEAPVGRQDVEGLVLAVKTVASQYGDQLKMMVELSNRSKVWCTVPMIWTPEGNAVYVERGDRLAFRATFERAKDDPSMAWGKRPTNAKVVARAVQEVKEGA